MPNTVSPLLLHRTTLIWWNSYLGIVYLSVQSCPHFEWLYVADVRRIINLNCHFFQSSKLFQGSFMGMSASSRIARDLSAEITYTGRPLFWLLFDVVLETIFLGALAPLSDNTSHSFRTSGCSFDPLSCHVCHTSRGHMGGMMVGTSCTRKW